MERKKAKESHRVSSLHINGILQCAKEQFSKRHQPGVRKEERETRRERRRESENKGERRSEKEQEGE